MRRRARLGRQGVEWTAMGPGGQSCPVGHWDIQVMDNLVQKKSLWVRVYRHSYLAQGTVTRLTSTHVHTSLSHKDTRSLHTCRAQDGCPEPRPLWEADSS